MYELYNINKQNDFLFIAYNLDFGYYIFGKINVKKGKVYNSIKFKPFGVYKEKEKLIIKESIGKFATFGGKNSFNVLFDLFNNREKAYKRLESRKQKIFNKNI